MKALPSVSPRWLALAAALAAAVLVIPTASARSAASIKGVGAGETDFGFTKFELSAHAEADPTTPENGFGQVKVVTANGSVTIDVRCVVADVVFGRPSATITGVVTRSTGLAPFPTGAMAIVVVSDGGEPSDALVDGFAFGPTTLPAETSCLGGAQGPGTPPNVTQGNIVVKV